MDGTAYIGLGSNLGDRLEFLRRGLAELQQQGARLDGVSQLYETSPMYVLDQPPFFNAAVRVATDEGPELFLERLMAIERRLERTRDRRFGPRTLDLDILLWGADGATVVSTPSLGLPHPRLLERAFALIPLADVAAEIIHPLCGRSIRELAEAIDRNGIDSVDGPSWAEVTT